MTCTHFTSCNYLTIRNHTGQYSLRIDGNAVETAKAQVSEIDAEIARLQRRRAAYSQFVKGNSVECPSALRI